MELHQQHNNNAFCKEFTSLWFFGGEKEVLDEAEVQSIENHSWAALFWRWLTGGEGR